MLIFKAILLCGVVGHIIAVWSMVSSCLELHGLTILKLNGARRLTAVSNVCRDAFMMSAQATVTMVGAGGVISKLTMYEHPLGPAAWILVSLLISAMLVVDRYRRWRQGKMYDRRVFQRQPHPVQRETDYPQGGQQ